MTLVGIGLLMGTVVMTAQAIGAGNTHGCGAIWRTALAHALGVGVLMGGVCAFGESVLLALGQPEDIAAGGGRVLVALGLGLPGMLLYVATSFFLEGIGRPLPGMFIIIGANILNVVLNWFLVFGHGGFPALGAEGAAIATSIIRWCMFAAAAFYVLRVLDRRRFGIAAPSDPNARLGPRLRRFGLPMGIAHGLESGAFASMTLMAGVLGAAEVGGFTVPMNLLALAFMGAIGLATAASVRVGNAVGRGDSIGVRWAGWVAVGVASVYLIAFSALFLLAPTWLARLYTPDTAVLAIAVPTILVCAAAAVPERHTGSAHGRASRRVGRLARDLSLHGRVLDGDGPARLLARDTPGDGRRRSDALGLRRGGRGRGAARLALPARVRPRGPASMNDESPCANREARSHVSSHGGPVPARMRGERLSAMDCHSTTTVFERTFGEGKRSAEPWNRPADGWVRCARTTEILPRQPFNASARPARHGSSE